MCILYRTGVTNHFRFVDTTGILKQGGGHNFKKWLLQVVEPTTNGCHRRKSSEDPCAVVVAIAEVTFLNALLFFLLYACNAFTS